MDTSSFGQHFGIQFTTMGESTSPHGSAAVRFAPYIEELQEFFASVCLRYGSPEDIIALTDRLQSSPSFADDLSSMIRAIVLREGGAVPHSQMLEILAVAIGGEKMDHAPQQYGQPLRDLLSFMTSVLRKPWNEPPGDAVGHTADLEHGAEPVRPAHESWRPSAELEHAGAKVGHNGSNLGHHSSHLGHNGGHTVGHNGGHAPRPERGEVVPFPTKTYYGTERSPGQAAAISAAADRAAQQLGYTERHGHSAPVLINMAHRNTHPADPFADPRMDRKVPDLVGDPTPADRSIFDPGMPADDAIDSPDFPEETSDADASTAVTLPLLSSRLNPPRSAVSTSRPPAPIHAEPEPSPPAASVPAPMWKLAADEVRGAMHVDAPVVPAPTSVPEAADLTVTASNDAHRSAAVQHLPAAPMTGETKAPLRNPLQAASEPSRYPAYVPRSPAGMLVAGAAILVLAGIIAAEIHQSPTELAGKQPSQVTPATTDQAVPQMATADPKPSAAVAPTPLTTAPTLSRVRHVTRVDDEDEDASGVAAPYSTPIPGQPAQPKPGVSGGQQQATNAPIFRPPSNEVASTAPQAGGGYSSGSNYVPQSYASNEPGFHPGVGSGYRSSEPGLGADVSRSSRGSRAVTNHSGQIEVSSGMMAGYLMSAPKPDYPGLARIAHIGGPVVLQAVIGKNGTVLATHVLSGHRLLRGAAQDAVRQWRFKPYMMDGHPVEVSTIVTVRFNQNR